MILKHFEEKFYNQNYFRACVYFQNKLLLFFNFEESPASKINNGMPNCTLDESKYRS